MKARIKETGEIVDVTRVVDRYIMPHHPHTITFEKDELDFDINDPDYWTRLEHTYAGMAMQGMLNNSLLITSLLKVNKSHENIVDEVTGTAVRYAHTLVEKLKEKEERK